MNFTEFWNTSRFLLSFSKQDFQKKKINKAKKKKSTPQFGEGNGTPLQRSCLENPMDGRAWWAAEESDTTERLHFHFSLSVSIGEGNGSPLHYSCLENLRDRGA